MKGIELKRILDDMSDEQLNTELQVHDHYLGEWEHEMVFEYDEYHRHLVLSVKYQSGYEPQGKLREE